MDENLHNIESLFHKALEDNKETPSASVWEAVDKNLDKENIISIRYKYRRLKRMSILLLLLLAGFSFYVITKMNIYGKSVTNDKLQNAVNKTGQNKDVASSATDIGTSAQMNEFDNSNKKGTSMDLNRGQVKSNQPEGSSSGRLLSQREENARLPGTSSKAEFSQQSNGGRKNNKKASFNAKHKITITASEAFENIDQNAKLAKNEIPVDFSSLLEKADEPVIIDSRIIDINHRKIIPLSIDLISKASMKGAGLAGETKAKPKSSKGQFFITGFFSPDIVRQPEQERMEVNTGGTGGNLEKAEKHKFSYSFGLFGEYRLNKHFGIQLGINRSKMNISNEPKLIFAQNDNAGNIKYLIHTSSGYGYFLPSFNSSPAIGDSLTTSVTNQSLSYTGIPLALAYTVTKRRIEIHAMAGIAINILTRASLQTTVTKNYISYMESINNLQGLEKIYYNGMAGIGIGYSLTKKISLIFDPTFRFALSSINEEQRLKSYPVSIGFQTGIRLRL